jgi:hypothetical protein
LPARMATAVGSGPDFPSRRKRIAHEARGRLAPDRASFFVAAMAFKPSADEIRIVPDRFP